MGKQATVIRLDEDVVRSARAFAQSPDNGYSSLDELVEVALRNQIALEGQPVPEAPASNLLAAVDPEPLAELAQPPPQSRDPLFVFSNRLSPFKVATRVLANMHTAEKGWPTVPTFGSNAADAARALGKTLRAEDERAGRTGRDRRWVAYPIGKNERSAANRFINSFCLRSTKGSESGPLLSLRLVGIVPDSKVALTQLGWRLAAEPSPLLGETDGLGTLSVHEERLFREAVAGMPGEVESVREFLIFVQEANGSMPKLTQLLQRQHKDWTKELVVSHRAAMLGRLNELGVITQIGRGPQAKVELTTKAAELLGSKGGKNR